MADMENTLDMLDEVAGKITSLRISAAGNLIDKEEDLKALRLEDEENSHPCPGLSNKICELEEECRVLKDAIINLEKSDKAFTRAYVSIVDQLIE